MNLTRFFAIYLCCSREKKELQHLQDSGSKFTIIDCYISSALSTISLKNLTVLVSAKREGFEVLNFSWIPLCFGTVLPGLDMIIERKEEASQLLDRIGDLSKGNIHKVARIDYRCELNYSLRTGEIG